MKFIKLDNVTIQKHLVLDMPYHNVVQTACQDGDITALLLHGNNKAYLFRQNLNNVQNKVLKFDNNPLLVLSKGAYGHTQSLIHAQELFVGNWIYTSCGSGVYTTHSKWGLDIMRFNGDYPAKYDILISKICSVLLILKAFFENYNKIIMLIKSHFNA